MFGGWTMPAYFFRSEPGAAELRRLARRESGRVCQRVLMIANLLEGAQIASRPGFPQSTRAILFVALLNTLATTEFFRTPC